MPAGICGPIGPTEQLPLVARLVNELELDLRHAHFWGMDEWVVDGREAPLDFPLSFARADMELCFNRIRPELRMPRENIHFPAADLPSYVASYDRARCLVMQGGQGEVKHWAFNDPPRRAGPYVDRPPTPEEYRRLSTRIVELHPMTIIQNARTSGGGVVTNVPTQAITVGPAETWRAEKVSIWHAGCHDNPFGLRLTTLMISQRIPDTAVPMSLLADHPQVQFNFYRGGIGTCETEMHESADSRAAPSRFSRRACPPLRHSGVAMHITGKVAIVTGSGGLGSGRARRTCAWRVKVPPSLFLTSTKPADAKRSA